MPAASRKRFLSLALWLIGAVGPAAAAPGVYGLTSLNLTRLQAKASNTGAPATGSSERAVGLRIGIGHQTDDPAWAYECTLSTPNQVDTIAANTKVTWVIRSYGCGGLYQLPHDETSRWFVKAAAERVRLRLSTSGAIPLSSSHTRWRPALSLGWKTDSSKSAGWRIEYQRTLGIGDEQMTGTFDVSTLHLSLYYLFK